MLAWTTRPGHSAAPEHPVNAFLADRKRQGGRGIGGWTADKKNPSLR
jgi:hypothetical protein